MEKKLSNTTPFCPDQGDIIYLDFDPQAGRRQALVLSPYSYNSLTKLVVVCPITNRKKGYPFESDFPQGLKITGVVLSDHVKSLSWVARNASFACKAPAETVDDVRAKIAALIG